MKTDSYYHELGATIAGTLRFGVGTNALPQPMSSFVGDAWFDSVKIVASTVYTEMEGMC